MRKIVILVLFTFWTGVSAHAETDLEALYQSFIPKSSECFSAKLENPAAAKCHASCDEAVVNLRLLVMGIPQPLSEEMKKQVATCEADYAAFAGATTKDVVVEAETAKENNTPEAPELPEAQEDSQAEGQAADDSYAALKTELAELGNACAEVSQNGHAKMCMKTCKRAVSDLEKINAGDANMTQTMKNVKGDVERLPMVRKCRLRHKISTT